MRPTYAGTRVGVKYWQSSRRRRPGWPFSGPLVAGTPGVDGVVLDAGERVGGTHAFSRGDSGRLAVGITHWGGEEIALTWNWNKDGRSVRVRTRRTPCSPG